MGDTETDFDCLLQDWRAGRVGKTELYKALREPMYQGARRGVAGITSQTPDDQDVENAVYIAFEELCRQNPAAVTSLVGLAKATAMRRGQDQGRAANRRRRQVDLVDFSDPAALSDVITDEDELAGGAEQERLFRRITLCLDNLTDEQRDVVQATVVGRESVSDWAHRTGKTHQSASRQRQRGLASLRRCVEEASGDRDEDEGGTSDERGK